jgi:3-deoxy-D-manno-octulosonic-acid transferase
MLPYRLLISLIAPLLLARLGWRVLRGRESRADLAERLGRGAGGAPGAVWLHGASNGELASARPLVETLLAARPDLRLVVTANTVTGRALVRGWGLDRVEARLAPLDLRPCLHRFRRVWQPVLLVVLENELWPNRIVTATEPVVCVGARMSARSFARWSRVPGLARALLGRVRLLFPQDGASAQRFAELGLAPARLGPVGTLKAEVTPAAPDPAALQALAPVFPRAETLLAASTHEGEEEILLQAFAAARRARPGLKLILAPRHPARGPALAALLARQGLRFTRRADGEAPAAEDAVYLADTLGEMALWYRLAGVTFVGGSLVDRGGHTPFEPAAAGSAILHGPHVSNFADIYGALDAGGGALVAKDAEGLVACLERLSSAQAQAALAERAAAVLAAERQEAGVADLVATRLMEVLEV